MDKINNGLDDRFIYKSESMTAIDSYLQVISPTTATVLITGETGTGKEVVARRIHELSGRKGKFIAVNCSAIVPTLIESELFGHEKGAFTDAVSQRVGKFELATGGTIFLDEIAEMDKYLQVKLLRVIQEMTIERVGGDEPIKIYARIIAATNKNVESSVSEGTFRNDLYYRLNVIRLHLPPLRVRRDDIFLLADSFAKTFCKKYSREYSGIDGCFRKYLESLNYPGNIRELKNIVERAVIQSLNGKLAPTLNFVNTNNDSFKNVYPMGKNEIGRKTLKEYMSVLEKDFILLALEKADGNKTKAARILGIKNRTTFVEKLKRHKVNLRTYH